MNKHHLSKLEYPDVRLDVEQKRDVFKNKAVALEKDRDLALKMHENDKKQVDELAREREILNKNLLKVSVEKNYFLHKHAH